MAKMYSKGDLEFRNGFVVSRDGDVVCLPDGVARQWNRLEVMVQKSAYLKAQPDEQKAPSLDGFEFESQFGLPSVEVGTPVLDGMVKKGMKLREEMARCDMASSVNKTVEAFKELMLWLGEDEFVEGTEHVRIDSVNLGDPLEATQAEALGILKQIAGLEDK